MSYRARDGNLYDYKETPSEYRSRHGYSSGISNGHSGDRNSFILRLLASIAEWLILLASHLVKYSFRFGVPAVLILGGFAFTVSCAWFAVESLYNSDWFAFLGYVLAGNVAYCFMKGLPGAALILFAWYFGQWTSMIILVLCLTYTLGNKGKGRGLCYYVSVLNIGIF